MAISIGKIYSSDYQRHLADNSESGRAEYYSSEKVPSEWSGRGAEMQNLQGEVDPKELVRILEGNISDATGERHLSLDNPDRLQGYDVTISAPKSVSMEALIHGNEDALNAHREANAEVLRQVESMAQTRIKSAGETEIEKTGNATIASFEHHESVAGDPHLHTHNAVANYTIDDKGTARALDARPIYNNIEKLRNSYDDTLEKSLNEKGIPTYRDENNHTQIQGYSKEGMQEFSIRQREMQERLSSDGREATAAAREHARQETRADQRFEPKPREQTTSEWKERAERTAGTGPAQKSQEGAAKPERAPSVPYEQLKEAKQTVNDAKAAQQRLENGNVRNEAHRAELESKIQAAQELKQKDPALYQRAEKAVEKTGVKDAQSTADRKIEQAAMERVQSAAQEKLDRDALDLNIAKWTVGREQEAKIELAADKHGELTEAYRAVLEVRIAKAEQLKSKDPDFYKKAEAAWNKDIQDTRQTIREAQDAQMRVSSGRTYSVEHRDDLKAALSRADRAQDQKGAMYESAERSIQFKREYEAAQRKDLEAMKETIREAQAALAKLSRGEVFSDKEKAEVKAALDKSLQAREKDKELYQAAEREVRIQSEKLSEKASRPQEFSQNERNSAMEKMVQTVKDAQDAQDRLNRGNFFSEQHREDLQSAISRAEQAKTERSSLYAAAEKEVKRESYEKTKAQEKSEKPGKGEGKYSSTGDGEKSGKGKPSREMTADKPDWKKNLDILKDADLATRAMKTAESGFMGFFKKNLSAKDRQESKVAYNSRGDKFYITKKGDVYAAGHLSNNNAPKAFSKKESTLLGAGQKEYMVTAKGDVFVRGKGFSGIGQKLADSLKGDGKGFAGKMWNRTVQDVYGSKWQKVEGAEKNRVMKELMPELDKMRKEYYTERYEMRKAFREDIKNAVAAINEKPREMAKAFNTMEKAGKDVTLRNERSLEKLKREAEKLKEEKSRKDDKGKGERQDRPKEQEKPKQQDKGRGWGD
jgi:conjugative relaxase-like TrwC/TraI family protein